MASRKKRPVPSKPARGGSRPGARTVRSAGSARGLQTTVGAVAEVIGSLEYPGAIIGGIAVIAWGHGRATSDVDCAIAAPISAAEEVLDAFEAAGFAPRYDGALAFARQNLLLPLTHTVTGVSVDASLAQLEFEHTALAHAVTLPFLDARIPVPPVTDLLIYKMVAGRPQDHRRTSLTYGACWRLDIGWTNRVSARHSRALTRFSTPTKQANGVACSRA